jgi:hypothetical protein
MIAAVQVPLLSMKMCRSSGEDVVAAGVPARGMRRVCAHNEADGIASIGMRLSDPDSGAQERARHRGWS